MPETVAMIYRDTRRMFAESRIRNCRVCGKEFKTREQYQRRCDDCNGKCVKCGTTIGTATSSKYCETCAQSAVAAQKRAWKKRHVSAMKRTAQARAKAKSKEAKERVKA